jgi:hypothetical protein
VTTILGSIALLWLLWLGYVFTMHVKAQWDRLHWSAKALGAPVAILAYCLDVLVNLTLATVVFADRPREATLTKRLHRYRAGWRNTVARFICQHLLNPFDPDHC